MVAVTIKRTVGGKIGHGSTPDILAVQKLLNRHASLAGYKKLEENGKVDKKTLAAIKKFQQVCCPDINADSRVEPRKQTLLSLNMSAADLKKWVKGVQSDDPGDAAQCIVLYVGKTAYEFNSQNDADKFAATIKQIEINGKTHQFTPKEWAAFQADMIKTLNRTIVVGAKSRAEMAYGLWEHFAELNNDQYVISWFVSLTGPDLPKFGIVNKASNAARNLEAAVKSGNFDRIGKAIKEAEEPINKAYKVMWDYQKAVIGSAENWVTALEVTKTTSFIIVGAIATPLLVPSAGLAGAGALASGGTALVGSTANELGKYNVGTSKGPADAIKNIALDTVIDGTVGAVLKGASGKKIFEGVGEQLVKKVGSKWIGKVGSPAVQKYLTAYLQNATTSGIEEAIKQVGEVIKGKTKPKDFFGKVATAMATGGFMKGFDKVVDDKLGKAVYDGISSKARKDIFGELKPAVAIGIINDVVKGSGGNFVSTGIEQALKAATGKESDTALVEAAAKKMTKGADFKKFQKMLADKAAKRKK
ncbi:peptidoglycan-binding protein [Parasedimentitalea marina]|uniref:Peptidoglycan-binding protein n=1 Tax=Parasedimentitalea marina TaxID=2483033 RepID=A0A3T0N4J5_9RHOB|nr:peptidoglycan-binding protein [Parasedimentitalea marina]